MTDVEAEASPERLQLSRVQRRRIRLVNLIRFATDEKERERLELELRIHDAKERQQNEAPVEYPPPRFRLRDGELEELRDHQRRRSIRAARRR